MATTVDPSPPDFKHLFEPGVSMTTTRYRTFLRTDA